MTEYCHIRFLYVHPIVSGSPTATMLTYNDTTRSLTCTSTGGPATTVTWRKNGTVITINATYQQTQVVTNSSTGTYETVLSPFYNPILGFLQNWCSSVSPRWYSSWQSTPGGSTLGWCGLHCWYVGQFVVWVIFCFQQLKTNEAFVFISPEELIEPVQLLKEHVQLLSLYSC